MQLTLKQAAELLQVDEARVRRWIRERGLPVVLFNEQYRLNRVDLLVWAQANRITLRAHSLTPSDPGAMSLTAALVRGGIHRDLAGAHRDDMLRALLQQVELPPAADRELLLEMVLAREARGTTAVGHDIAIPHARYPIVLGMAEPMLALGFPLAPIDFGAPSEPLAALFLLLVPNIRTHLHLLARLARALETELLAPVQARAADAVILDAAAASDAAADRDTSRCRV